jgi:hypothetical protein
VTGSFEHYCRRSDDAEAALRNLALFGHLSGENRARMGWPRSVRIRAYLLSGEDSVAMQLADDYAMRLRALRPDRPSPEIPHQREPFETRTRKTHHWGDLSSRYARNETPYSGT